MERDLDWREVKLLKATAHCAVGHRKSYFVIERTKGSFHLKGVEAPFSSLEAAKEFAQLDYTASLEQLLSESYKAEAWRLDYPWGGFRFTGSESDARASTQTSGAVVTPLLVKV